MTRKFFRKARGDYSWNGSKSDKGSRGYGRMTRGKETRAMNKADRQAWGRRPDNH